MGSRTEAVREVFEDTAQYLKFDYNLRIRKETLQSFTRGLKFDSVLDMPCGNGEISKPLLKCCKEIVLMDISENMIELASKNVRENSGCRVFVENKDFFLYDFGKKKFDLIVCFGLMAHVESPEKLMEKLSSLLNSSGLLVFQNTDAAHFYNKLIRIYLGFRKIFKKSPYSFNQVEGNYIESYFQKKGLKLLKKFRYNQSFLGFSNLFSNEKKYRITRSYFGDADQPKNQEKGSDVTYLFRKISD